MSELADEDGAVVKPDAGLEGESEMISQIPIEILHGGEHPQTRPHGLARVFVMRRALESEDGEHAVAKVLVDDAVVGEDRVAKLLEEAVEGVTEVVSELTLSNGGEIANVAEEQPDLFLFRGGPVVGFTPGEIGVDGVMHVSADAGWSGWTALAGEPHGFWPAALRRQFGLFRRARAEGLQAVNDQHAAR